MCIGGGQCLQTLCGSCYPALMLCGRYPCMGCDFQVQRYLYRKMIVGGRSGIGECLREGYMRAQLKDTSRKCILMDVYVDNLPTA